MIDLKGNPFFLNDEDIEWVYKTLNSLSVEEKVGQTFFLAASQETEEGLYEFYKEIPFGGFMDRRRSDAKMAKERVDFIQKNAKVPMLVAANLEQGGSGCCTDGTYFANQEMIAATNDPHNAYLMGEICGKEGSAVGVNYAFAPVVDIDYNWRNPITNTRTYGDDPERVVQYAGEYMKAVKKYGLCVSIKHFPGDGVDERDQHVAPSINSLSTEEWDRTYGMVYKTLIDEGARTVMVGHIMQPAYSRAFNPEIQEKDLLPASISYDLVTKLLRGKLGFNGMVITDSTQMTGMCMLPRKDIPAAVINAGCDMFLFGKNTWEDYRNMLNSAKTGEISPKRLDEAVIRILALKASLGLHRKEQFTRDDYAEIVGCKEHSEMAKKVIDQGITLLKDSQNLLPINNTDHKRIWLFALGDMPGMRGGRTCRYDFIRILEEAGFEVDLYDNDSDYTDMDFPTAEGIVENYDLIIYLANLHGGTNRSATRIDWALTRHPNTPQYTFDVPTLFVSVDNPYHFIDVPHIRTQINCYQSTNETLQILVDKLMGKSEFKGISPIDPFCGSWGKDY